LGDAARRTHLGPLVAVIVEEAELRTRLARVLERAGYRVASAPDGETGIRVVHELHPSLVLLDLSRDSSDFRATVGLLRQAANSRDVPLIALASRRSGRHLDALLEIGVADFVSRPVSHHELIARVRTVLAQRAVDRRREEARAIVASLANAVEAKDPSIDGHCRRLAYSASRLAASVGLRGDELEAVAFGAILHDIGKIAMSDHVLNKPGPLDDVELERMREHPEIGGRICDPLASAARFGPIIRHHHERWDGLGYPRGLSREQIPLGARIVAIADAYDAITFGRPYRRARTHEQAVAELTRCSGSQFDPGLVPEFIAEADRAASGIPPLVELPIAHLVVSHVPVSRRIAVGPGVTPAATIEIEGTVVLTKRPARAA
jgi:putative two-component system response regulator